MKNLQVSKGLSASTGTAEEALRHCFRKMYQVQQGIADAVVEVHSQKFTAEFYDVKHTDLYHGTLYDAQGQICATALLDIFDK